ASLREVTLLFCDPLLQSEVRRDDERGHGRLPSAGALTRDSTLFLAGALSSSGLHDPAPRDIQALEPSRVLSMNQFATERARRALLPAGSSAPSASGLKRAVDIAPRASARSTPLSVARRAAGAR